MNLNLHLRYFATRSSCTTNERKTGTFDKTGVCICCAAVLVVRKTKNRASDAAKYLDFFQVFYSFTCHYY